MTTFHCSLNNELKFNISNYFSRNFLLLLVERILMTNQYDTLIVLVLMILVVYIFSYIRSK